MNICIPCTTKKFGVIWSHVDVFTECDLCGRKMWCFTRDEITPEEPKSEPENRDEDPKAHESGATVYNFRDYVKLRAKRS